MKNTAREHVFNQYLRTDKLPHIWCAGCGLGTGINSFIRAVDQLGLDQDKLAVVSGIGCSGRASGYLDFCGFQPTHGRALPFATGIKQYNPELTVVTIMGDGDGASIGGNHLIHAARRNIDITALFFNNSNYGMTGGQYAPTTPPGSKTSTSPYGHVEAPFDVCKLVEAAGATYIARGTVYQARQLVDLMASAIEHRGFSLVEVICQCPTLYGRFNKQGGVIEMLKWQRANTINVEAAKKLKPEELAGKLAVGELVKKNQGEFTDDYQHLVASIQKGEQG